MVRLFHNFGKTKFGVLHNFIEFEDDICYVSIHVGHLIPFKYYSSYQV